MKIVLRNIGKTKKDYPGKVMWERWIDDKYIGFAELHFYFWCLQTKLDAWLAGRLRDLW